jgi:hypothetical protein
MQSTTKVKTERRQQDRIQGVLAVRVRGKDSSGALFEALAHTLDLTSTGARLGSIHHELKALDTLVVLFRKRRIEFTVMWTKLLGQPKNGEPKDAQPKNGEPKAGAHNEYQVGLQMMSQENGQSLGNGNGSGNDPWGLGLPHSTTQPFTRASAVSGAA